MESVYFLVINLKRSGDRYKVISKSLDELDVKYERVEAVDCNNMNNIDNEECKNLLKPRQDLIGKTFKRLNNSWVYDGTVRTSFIGLHLNGHMGTKALTLSNLKSFEIGIQRQEDWICIIEDDAVIDIDVITKIYNFITIKESSHFDVVLLDSRGYGGTAGMLYRRSILSTFLLDLNPLSDFSIIEYEKLEESAQNKTPYLWDVKLWFYFRIKKTKVKVIKCIKSGMFVSTISIEQTQQIEQPQYQIIHDLYYKYIGKPASIINSHSLEDLEDELKYSIEHKVYKRKIEYFKNNLNDDMYQYIFNRYIFDLYYQPSSNKLEKYYILEKQLSRDDLIVKINEDIDSSSDFKYLEECRLHFYSLCPNQEKPQKISKIKYYGPVGITGYAKVCREICSLLKDDIDFECIQFQSYDMKDYHKELSSLVYKSSDRIYDYVVLHSQPELWPNICKKERDINKNVIIYGISVWETDDIPKEWIPYINYVDKMSTPSEFSSNAFRKYFHGVVDVVYHPVSCPKQIDNICKLSKLTHKYDYIFYNVSEWTNRKGISELIEIYLQTFDKENVLLYIKTHGDISHYESNYFISTIRNRTKSSAKIMLDYDRVTDEYIDCINICADCYVSCAKSEGHGVGICQSVLAGKYAISTNYSAPVEYLKHIDSVDFIDYKLEPATYCAIWCKQHQKCKDLPHCSNFNGFIPSIHRWANINKEECGKKMKEAFINKKKGTRIEEGLFKNFKECFYNSLLSSDKYARSDFLSEQIISYIPQRYIFNYPKKKLLILNCGGYGNVGDDSYNEIYKHYFKDYEIFFVRDCVFLTVNNEYIYHEKWNVLQKNHNLMHFDYMIIGGGGMFRYNNKSSLSIYTEYAITNKIPYFILSVGFQDLDLDLNSERITSLYNYYKNTIENASYISVRSINDYFIIKSYLDKTKSRILHYYPDLVYSIKTICNINYPIDTNKKYLLFLMTDFMSIKWDHVREYIYKIIEEKQLTLITMNWAGVGEKNNIKYLNLMTEEKKLLDKYFPGTLFYQGLKYDFNFKELFDILNQTHTIITGRYHGKVLGRVFNIKVIDFHYDNYKFVADDESHGDISLASEPLSNIKNYMDNNFTQQYYKWDGDKRNATICNLHRKTDWSINFIQNFSNMKLEELNTFL